jgi:hypothetical protein
VRDVKLYNGLLWLLNAALAGAIAYVIVVFLAQQPNYVRDVQLDDGASDAPVKPPPKRDDAALKLRNPVENKVLDVKQPDAPVFRAQLKGTLPGDKGDGPGAAFLKSAGRNVELVAFTGEVILFEGKEFDEYRGWKLSKVWKDRALFAGPGGLTQELTIEATAGPAGPAAPGGARVGGARGAKAGQPYQPDQFKSRLLASADSRQVWGLDPEEIDWASQNADKIMDGDFQVSPNSGGGVRVEGVTPGSIGAARGVVAGDVIRDVNGQPLNSIADVRTLMNNPAFKSSSGLRITVERAGKPVVLEYRPLPR